MEIIEKLRDCLNDPAFPQLEDLRFKLAELLTNKGWELAEKRRQVLWPKDKDLTELDRKIRLEADTAQLERDYTLLKLAWEVVSDRLKR